jgi:hypothetical protein
MKTKRILACTWIVWTIASTYVMLFPTRWNDYSIGCPKFGYVRYAGGVFSIAVYLPVRTDESSSLLVEKNYYPGDE